MVSLFLLYYVSQPPREGKWGILVFLDLLLELQLLSGGVELIKDDQLILERVEAKGVLVGCEDTRGVPGVEI